MSATSRSLALFLCSAALLTWTAAAGATTVPGLDLNRMAGAASSVVYGTVENTRCRWNADHTLIVTDVAFRVAETLKGPGRSAIVFTQPGGVLGKLKVETEGASTFRPGDEAVLFLAPNREGTLFVHGLGQGRFDVRTDSRTGEKTVSGLTPERLKLLDRAAPSAGIADAAARGPVPLGRFLRGMRAVIREAVDMEGK